MAETQALVKKIYPMVETSLSTNIKKWRACLSHFTESRSEELFDTVPCSRIFYTDEDRNEFFTSLDIDSKKVQEIINEETYYGSIAAFTPKAAKDPTTCTAMMVIRYFLMHNMDKELELACIYLAFSGKFYPSLHYNSWRIVPIRYVMEWVVNYRLSQKFDIISKGSIFGAIKSICNTWVNSYKSRFKSSDDSDMVYLIQQLHNRISSFMKNIASEYYDAYKNKDEYIVYDSDNPNEDNYHLADNDSLRAQRIIEKSTNRINTSQVNFRYCKMCSDSNISTTEIKSIIESILMDTDNIPIIKELIELLVMTYFTNSKTKDVRDVEFITFSTAPKPNAKDKNITRIKDITEELLLDNSKNYIRRRSRDATKNSYQRALLMYFTLMIHDANK